ncbi:MAG: hypothetical protein EBR59_10530, partial [Methylococcaceae bacterium]|nr:hypothetical protein [Methylococcaceae bacterium]
MLVITTWSFVVYLIPGMWGAPLKFLAGYLPPMHTQDFRLGETTEEAAGNTESCQTPKYAGELHIPHGIQGYFDYEEALACAKAQKKPDKEKIATLEREIQEANKRANAAYEKYADVVKGINPQAMSAASAERAALVKMDSIAKQHDALVDTLTKQGKTSEEIAEDPQIKTLYSQMQQAVKDAQAKAATYQGALSNANSTGAVSVEERATGAGGAERRVSYQIERGEDGKFGVKKTVTNRGFSDHAPSEEDAKSGSVKSNPYDTAGQYGPGWWGIGTTLDHQQAAALQWSIGQNAKGQTDINSRNMFTSENITDPTQTGVTVQQGGSGASQYNVQGNAGVNLLNVEHRDFDMLYSGSTGHGFGIGGMVGDQARADIADATIGVNTSGGEATIGGEHINNLATSSITGQAAIGAQSDVDVNAGIGQKGA